MVGEASKIREEIAGGRAELADTIQALVEKADVKSRMHEAISENATHLQRKAGQAASQLSGMSHSAVESARTSDSAVYVAGGLGALLLLTLLLLRRGRSD